MVLGHAEADPDSGKRCPEIDMEHFRAEVARALAERMTRDLR
jgi:hypothetical protein